jgi:tripartite-type tricarboxylate transporter receptor subunit TctC
MTSQKAVPAFIALLGLLAFSVPVSSQDYPNRPLRIVVGFTPGGGPDITARHIAQRLAEPLKQQVVVENRPGAGGTLAAALVARSAPDGYTLLSVSSAHAAAAAIYAKLPYETRDLAGVIQTGSSKYVLVVPPSLKISSERQVSSVQQLLAEARANPGRINFSSAGVGSGTHFAAEIFKALAQIDVVHIPFKGIPEALTEVMTGRVQFFMAPIANSVAQVKDGRLVGLGVSSLSRDPLLPDLPTISEAGLPGYESELWFGLLAPAATPPAVMARLNDEIARILRDADTRARWAPIGISPRASTPQEFDRLIGTEVALFSRIARAAAIKAE